MANSFFDRITNLGDELYRMLQGLYDSFTGVAGSAQTPPTPVKRPPLPPRASPKQPSAKREPRAAQPPVPRPPRQPSKGNETSLGPPAIPSTPIVPVLPPKREQAPAARPLSRRADDICSKYGLYPLTFVTNSNALDDLAGRAMANVRRQFFTGQIVGATGHGPYSLYDMRVLVRRLGGTIGFDGLWQAEQLLIIGHEGFDSNYLRHSVQIGQRKGFVCRYITQDALADLLLLGKEPQYYRGDPRITAHPGLSYLARLGFVWPTTDASPSDDSILLEEPNGWKDKHDLRAVYGYSVDSRENLSTIERQQRLRRAVAGLGLAVVAEHIAWLIKNAKRRHDGRMDGAIEKWEDDMGWLYDTFYRNSIHSFIWPTIYRRRRKAS